MDINARRKQLNLTLKDVADFVGVSEATVSRWESGDIANMRRDRIANLSKILKVSPIDVMGIESEEQPHFPERNAIDLSAHEKKVISAYRDHPEMQKPVDRLLGIEEEKIHIIPIAARNGNNKPLKLTDSELETLKNLPDVPPEL